MKNWYSREIIFSATLFFVFMIAISAQSIPPVIPNTFVQDHAGVLDDSDEKAIEVQLRQFKTAYNVEFAVVTVRSTEPHPIEEFGIKMAREYGIGSKQGEKRGLMLLLATSDRKWRFEISRHMEGVITDGQSGSIGRNSLVPKLKVASKTGNSTDWTDAILTTVAATNTLVAKNVEPEQTAVVTPVTSSQPTDWTGLIVVLIVLFPLSLFGFVIYRIARHRQEVREAIAAQQLADEKAIREEKALRERMEREAANRERIKLEKEEAIRRETERAIWLKTPDGIAWTKAEKEKERKFAEAQRLAAEQEAIRQEAHRKWLLTPEGIADTAQKAEAAKLARIKREAEQRAEVARQQAKEASRRRQDEEERQARRRRDEESSSYSSSSSSSSSSSYDSGSSSSSSGFGGGSDFGGGGSSGSF